MQKDGLGCGHTNDDSQHLLDDNKELVDASNLHRDFSTDYKTPGDNGAQSATPRDQPGIFPMSSRAVTPIGIFGNANTQADTIEVI